MSAPALMFAVLGGLAAVTLATRRRTVLPFILASVGTALLGLFVLYAPLESAISLLGVPLKFGDTWQILGRPLRLDAQDRAGVGFLLMVGALFFGGGWAAKPGRSFLPAGLIALGFLAGSLTIEPFLFAAIFLELAAMACVLILIPPGSRSDTRVLNLLVLYSMAMMAILFTGWLLENAGVTSVTPELALRVILLLGVGFAILLFVPPFHYWLPSVAETTSPYSLAFVAIILQSSGMFFLFRFLDNFLWMRADARVATAIQIAGLVLVVFGTLAAISQHSYLKLGIYALLADIGISLLAVGSNIGEGFQIALGLTSVRVVSLGAWGLGAAILVRVGQGRAAGWGAPLAAATSLVGLISLAGSPLTAGFPWRWSMLIRLPGLTTTANIVMLLSTLALLWTAIRWATVLFADRPVDAGIKQPRVEQMTLAAAIGFCLLLGLLPQLTIPWVIRASLGLANLGS